VVINMKTKSLLGITLGLAIISSGFYYIANEFISAKETSLWLQGPSLVKPEDVFDVQVLLVTKQEVYGVDVFIDYDPTLLEVVDVPVGDSVFDDYPGSFPGPDFVAFSAGIKGGGEPFSGLGTVGAVRFKALEEGNTTLSIRHVKGNTADSNVATPEGDILDSVRGLDLTISSTTPKGK
jgi:hypothetical protein